MGGFSTARYFLFLVALLLIISVLLFWNGLLMITIHEGDAMHAVQILMRMELGQLPHLDFLTPIGILSFAPISLFMPLGVGKAIMAGNVLMAALSIPALLWIGKTRLSAGLAYGLGAGILILMTAMVHGDDLQVTSISMYYNRWAWAISFLIILIAILPAKDRGTQILDGIILAVGLSFLALSKMTYFVALLPAIMLAILMRRQWQAMLVAMIVGAIVFAITTIWTGGFGFWGAYLSDLLTVGGGDVRGFPSKSLTQLLVGPSFLALNLILLLSVVLLRQSGQMVEGLILLVLAPAFVFITYQNWGNDPQWLFLLGIIMLALRPDQATRNAFGWDVRVSIGTTGILALAIIAPSALNLAFSSIIHARLDKSDFSVLLQEPRHHNLVVQTKMLYAPVIRDEITIPNTQMAELGAASAGRKTYTLYDEPLRSCVMHRGLGGIMQFIARDLDSLGYVAGKSVFVADLYSNLWLFGSTVPIKNGSPWYYGGDVGMGRADYLLVPFCPSTQSVWAFVIEALGKDGAPQFKEVHRTDIYTLFERVK